MTKKTTTTTTRNGPITYLNVVLGRAPDFYFPGKCVLQVGNNLIEDYMILKLCSVTQAANHFKLKTHCLMTSHGCSSTL